MSARLWTSLLGIVIATVDLLGYNSYEGNEPALGLDLQGGASVVLEPVTEADREDLEFVAELVRDAVDSLGIAEPDVRVEGDTIVVDLPGVDDQDEALELVNVSGEVSLHPVLQCIDPTPEPTATTTPGASPTTVPTSTPTSSTTESPASIGSSTPPSAPSTTGATTPATTTGSTTTATPSGFRNPDPTDPPTVTTSGDTTDPPPTTAPSSTPSATTSPGSTTPASSGPATTLPPATTTTTPFFVATTVAPEPSYPITNSDGTLIMETSDGLLCNVGPSGATGQVFQRKSSDAVVQGASWGVTTQLSGSGVGTWNTLAAECYAGSAACPSRQLAIALDGEIVSAPVVQQPSFTDEVSITGTFTETEARDLASVLNRGAYPFKIEPQTVQGVSASSGEEALRAVLIAGAVGIAFVMLFMLLYYRALAGIILVGLLLSGAMLYAVISLLSAQRNLTLTIAGCAGIIVSVGVTVDSYVVFFERLKDEVRHGRSLRNSAARGFSASWRTILNGNLASLIGALVLFWLSVGSVRGFAFFLALSTIIDLIVAYFFTRPVMLLLARSGKVGTRKVFGIDTSTRDIAGGVS
ncbi:hypothetical protein BH24ACT6_BH24ACT6_15400 [soil metagenome]